MRRKALLLFFLFAGVSLSLLSLQNVRPAQSKTGAGLQGMATPDPLAIPTLPANPGPVDVGRSVYYYDCMPCHGDKGQGLTTEWRQVWVPDHQNCWNRGCHAGRPGDEGFPLPKTIPAVVGAPLLARFPDLESLAGYLAATHPPQRPGALSKEDYVAVASFLYAESGVSTANENAGVHLTPADFQIISAFLLIVAILVLALDRQSHVG